MTQKNIFIASLLILVIAVAGYFVLIKNRILNSQSKQTIFISREECEQKTGKPCVNRACDYVPSGKTFEEVCGKDFKKGWVVKSSIELDLNQPTVQTKEDNFQYGEIIKSRIGAGGGILQNTDKSVIVIIPPLKQETEFTLSFKRSDFEVRSGQGSPLTISIYPDISFADLSRPISIKIKYDARYNLPVPYRIDEENKLQSVDIEELDKENRYLTMYTFRGGNYSWIYAAE